MTNIKDKILSSGLIDKHTATLLEKWGHLQPGDSEQVREDTLKGATQDQLEKLADEIGEIVEKDHGIRETNLDLGRLKWPTSVDVYKLTDYKPGKPLKDFVAQNLLAVIDGFGRFYFRSQDVRRDWFVPGYILSRKNMTMDNGYSQFNPEFQIVEVSELFHGDQPIAIQVSVTPS